MSGQNSKCKPRQDDDCESKRRRERRRRHKYSESSSSSESSETCTEEKKSEQKEKKNSKKCSKKTSKKHSRKCSKKDSKHCKKRGSKKTSKKGSKKGSRKCDSSSSDSDSDSICEKKCNFDDLYKYYKFRLLTDETLMAGGSDAYIYSTNTTAEIIPNEAAVNMENVFTNYNIDNLYKGSPFFVRKAGIYNLYFLINSDEAIQMCVFVNGNPVETTRSGNNSGAGQLIIQALLKLNKDDAVVIRNNSSTTLSLTSNLYAGGLLVGNPSTISIFKIASYEESKTFEDCVNCRQERLYKKLEEKLVCDKDLMLKGFNTHGSFYATLAQDVALEADFIWASQLNVCNLKWDATTPERVTIMEDGVYKLFFLADLVRAAQVTVTVNGTPVNCTTSGVNKGSSQLSIWTLLELKKDDYVTIRNHTSANGTLTTFEKSGGNHTSVGAALQLFKISSLNKPVEPECKLGECYEKCYIKFRNYLLKQKCLILNGSPTFSQCTSDTFQSIPLNSTLSWDYISLQKDMLHKQGTATYKILKSGIYNVVSSIITNEPVQFSMFVNGVIDDTTTSGRNSGSSRCILKQFVKLKMGDVVTFVNHDSYAGTVNTALNAGGSKKGNNRVALLYYLSEN